MVTGFRILPKTKNRIDYLAKLNGKSKSAVVAEKLDGAPTPPPLPDNSRIAVSYSMDEGIKAHLDRIAIESGRSQAEVLDFLFGDN